MGAAFTRPHHPIKIGLFFLLFDGDDFFAFVMTAVRANGMRQAHFAAVAALDQVVSL